MSDRARETLDDLWDAYRSSNPITYVQEYSWDRIYGGKSHDEAVRNTEGRWVNDQEWTRDPTAQVLLTLLGQKLGIPIPREFWAKYNKWWDEVGVDENVKDFGKSLFVYLWALGIISGGIYAYRSIT